MYNGPVSVEYETKEGAARFKKDFEYTAGKLVRITSRILNVVSNSDIS